MKQSHKLLFLAISLSLSMPTTTHTMEETGVIPNWLHFVTGAATVVGLHIISEQVRYYCWGGRENEGDRWIAKHQLLDRLATLEQKKDRKYITTFGERIEQLEQSIEQTRRGGATIMRKRLSQKKQIKILSAAVKHLQKQVGAPEGEAKNLYATLQGVNSVIEDMQVSINNLQRKNESKIGENSATGVTVDNLTFTPLERHAADIYALNERLKKIEAEINETLTQHVYGLVSKQIDLLMPGKKKKKRRFGIRDNKRSSMNTGEENNSDEENVSYELFAKEGNISFSSEDYSSSGEEERLIGDDGEFYTIPIKPENFPLRAINASPKTKETVPEFMRCKFSSSSNDSSDVETEI